MSLHLLPLRCRARSGGFAVGRADSGAACPARYRHGRHDRSAPARASL